MEQSDTDVPDDDDFLVEWDEWSEVENGRGPMADWNHNNVYDAERVGRLRVLVLVFSAP